MPTPKKNEKKKDFIKRCIPYVMDEGRKQDQATAICYSIWDESKKGKEVNVGKMFLRKILEQAFERKN